MNSRAAPSSNPSSGVRIVLLDSTNHKEVYETYRNRLDDRVRHVAGHRGLKRNSDTVRYVGLQHL